MSASTPPPSAPPLVQSDSQTTADAASTAPPTTTTHRHRHQHHSHATGSARDGAEGEADSGAPSPATRTSSSSKSPTSARHRSRRSRRAANPGATGGEASGDGAAAALSMAGILLCCDGVSVQRHGRDVIDDVSCLVRGGRVTAVVNCCGTHSALALLAVMAGRVESAAGNTLLNGMPVSASAYQSQLGFLEDGGEVDDQAGGEDDDDEDGACGKSQRRRGAASVASSGLLAELTVRENLQYASALRVANSAQAYSVDEVLQQLLLEPHESAKIKDCSLYVRRRVALGKELLLNPSVLLLDEPLEGLATHESQQYLTILTKLAAPSAADAEARHVMREAMSAATPPAAAATASASAAMDVALYTPRHSRLSRRSPAAASPSATASTTMLTDPTLTTEAQRVVVVSMVQPRWTLLQYVHDVVLLERSRCVFAGSVQDMLQVRLPKRVLRVSMAAGEEATGLSEESSAAAAAAGIVEGDDGSVAPPAPPAAPTDSYDAVAAAIQQQRLGEQIVHGLYRLASTSVPTTAAANTGATSAATALDASAPDAATAAGGVVGEEPGPEYGSIIHIEDLCEERGSGAPTAAAPVVHADGPVATPLSQLYAHRRAGMRATVRAFMEAFAMGQMAVPEASYQPPSSLVQLLQLFRFDFLEMRHNPVWKALSLIGGLALAAVLAALYGRQEGQGGMQNRVGIIFFLVGCVVLQAVLSLDALRRQYAAFQRYSACGYYGAGTYLVFRAVTAALWRFGLASFVALVVFVLSNFGEPWNEYRGVFELSVILAVTSFCAHFGVWFLCAWWPSDRVGHFVVFTFYTLNIILAGLVLNLRTLPAVVQVVSFASVVRLAFESCILTQFEGKSFGCHEGDANTGASSGAELRVWLTARPSSLSPTAHRGKSAAAAAASAVLAKATKGVSATSACYTGSEYAEFLGFTSSRRWTNVLVLTGISGLLLMGSWVLMAFYRPRRRMKMPS